MVSFLVVFSSAQLVSGYGGPPEQSDTNNYTVEISFENQSYVLGESIIFSGNVNKYDQDRNLRISIFDSNNNIVNTQKTPVNPDGTFSHNVVLNEKFSDGKFIVKSQYGSSKATIKITSFIIQSDDNVSLSQNNKIPDWIKSNAGWWASGQIDDNSFVEGIQFLIKEGLMKISN